MKRCLIFLLISFLYSIGMQADNHALLIGVGNYPSDSGWGKISSVNDVRLLGKLLNRRFEVDSLLDDQATYQGIVTAFDDLCQRLSPGDTVLVHFSSHGQQIYTTDPAEPDFLDESIVPFDAYSKRSSFYHGERHLRDDQIGVFIDRLRSRLGHEGLAVITVDSCFSDSMNKGGDEDHTATDTRYRGGMEIFNIESIPVDSLDIIMETMMYDEPVGFTKESEKSNVVLVSACRSYQKNREIEVDGVTYGSLSYSMYDSFLSNDFSNIHDWINGVMGKMADVAFSQNPQIRSTIDCPTNFVSRKEHSPQEKNYLHEQDDSRNILFGLIIVILLSFIFLLLVWGKKRIRR